MPALVDPHLPFTPSPINVRLCLPVFRLVLTESSSIQPVAQSHSPPPREKLIITLTLPRPSLPPHAHSLTPTHAHTPPLLEPFFPCTTQGSSWSHSRRGHASLFFFSFLRQGLTGPPSAGSRLLARAKPPLVTPLQIRSPSVPLVHPFLFSPLPVFSLPPLFQVFFSLPLLSKEIFLTRRDPLEPHQHPNSTFISALFLQPFSL